MTDSSNNNFSNSLVVLQLLPHFNGGSVVREVLDSSIYLKERGFTPIVVSSGGNLVRFLVRAGIKHIEMDFASRWFWNINKNAKKIANLIKLTDASIVHAHSRNSAWAAQKAVQKVPCHLVTSVHKDYDFGFFGGDKKYNAILTQGERVIAVSTYIAAYLKENYNFNYENLKIVPKWVDVKAFDPSQVGSERIIKLASTWRLPDGVKIIMMAGDIKPSKGNLLMLHALEKLKTRNVLCLMIARSMDNSYKAKLKRYMKKHNLQDYVHIIEGCADMPAAYMLADVFVSPSLRPEAFGTAILEAQAMGRPVIASNFGSSLEIVKPDITGKFFEAGNAEDLAEKIDWALNLSDENRANVASRSIINARVKFSDMSMCERIFDTYIEVLGVSH
jgi:glycosyltransferase involved in cell wall biosynthesis